MAIPTRNPTVSSTMTESSNIDAFLYIEDQKGAIKGESKDKTHKDKIQVSNFRFGAEARASEKTGTGLGAGKAMLKEFIFEIHGSKASPVLFGTLCTGMHCPKAELYVRKAGGKPQDFYVFKFWDLIITDYQLDCADDITETIAFKFTKIHTAFSPQKADGSLDSPVEFEYDVKLNDKT
jgi:type VI secretion system secreted protein Hcp